jgi:hypothetical protein
MKDTYPQSAVGRVLLDNRKLRSNRLGHFPPRWKDAQCRPGASIDNRLPVHKYLELAIGSMDQLNLNLQFAPQSRRHTDGVQCGHSISTVAHLDLRHIASLLPEPEPRWSTLPDKVSFSSHR